MVLLLEATEAVVEDSWHNPPSPRVATCGLIALAYRGRLTLKSKRLLDVTIGEAQNRQRAIDGLGRYTADRAKGRAMLSRIGMIVAGGWVCLSCGLVWAAEGCPVESAGRYGLLVPGQFLQIPGPNPVLLPGPAGAWDDGVIEAADAIRDAATYYFFYHGTGAGKGYRLGVATSAHPLGPFRKHGDRPILDLGPPGTWDDRNVACAMILREGPGKYWMWYSATGASPRHAKWSIGLASAAHPLGPWKKHEGNPILNDFGYVGGVVKVKGNYFLYTAYPIGSTGPDYSPMALAVADSPTGPWTRWPGNPVLKEGPKGDWDHGGFSEAEVFYAGGAFHLFYGGATIDPVRIRTRESIGYAFSADGYHFAKHPGNPVARREASPNAAAFAEVHAIHEPPFIYLYHTLRYLAPRTPADEKKFPTVENLGIQVLATSRPFEFDMPILQRDSLGPKTTTPVLDSPPVSLSGIQLATVTAQCVYHPKAAKGIRIHVLPSSDGLRWGAPGLLSADSKPGQSARTTWPLGLNARYVKILVENPDPSESVANVDVTVRLGG